MEVKVSSSWIAENKAFLRPFHKESLTRHVLVSSGIISHEYEM